jgi:hypothetical protein
MTGQRFDRDLSVLLQELGDRPMPEYRHRIVERAEGMRQRPAWTFPSRWLPKELVMDTPMTAMRPIAGSTRRLGLVLAVAALILVLLVLALGAGRRTTPPFGLARNGELIYVANGDVMVRDTPSAPARRLISSPERETFAYFDRQGSRFVFFRETTAPAFDVWISDADGSDVRRLAGPFHDMQWWDWSTDGSAFAMEVYDAENISRVAIIPTDGSAARTLPLLAQSPVWRPGHRDQLLVRTHLDGAWRLVLVDPATGTITRRLDLPVSRQYDLMHPNWSPTGDRVVFDSQASDVAPSWRIHVARIADDGAVVSETGLVFDPDAAAEGYAAFMPDGVNLLYSPHYDSGNEIRIGRADGVGGSRRLGRADVGDGLLYEISPDGKTVEVVSYSRQKSWTVDVASGDFTDLDLGPDLPASWQRQAP